MQKCIVYRATVKSDRGEVNYYLGTSDSAFKQRYGNHKKLFKNKCYEKDTELSKYIWQLNDNNITYDLKWSVAARCSPYICGSSKCDLCITEKLLIARKNPESSCRVNFKSSKQV